MLVTVPVELLVQGAHPGGRTGSPRVVVETGCTVRLEHQQGGGGRGYGAPLSCGHARSQQAFSGAGEVQQGAGVKCSGTDGQRAGGVDRIGPIQGKGAGASWAGRPLGSGRTR